MSDLPRAKAEPVRTAARVAEPSAQALLVGAQHVDAEGAVGDKELHKRSMRLLAPEVMPKLRGHAKGLQAAE